MNQQEIEKTDDFQETEESETVALDELTVNDEQAEQVKDGPTGGGGFGGSTYLNHNETTAEDEEVEPESLDDLAVDDDEQVKGGPSTSDSRIIKINHNETIGADDQEPDAMLDDLQPSDALAEAVVAGAASPDVIVTREDKDRR